MLLISILYTLNLNLVVLDLPNEYIFGINNDESEPFSEVFDEIGY